MIKPDHQMNQIVIQITLLTVHFNLSLVAADPVVVDRDAVVANRSRSQHTKHWVSHLFAPRIESCRNAYHSEDEVKSCLELIVITTIYFFDTTQNANTGFGVTLELTLFSLNF